MIQIKNLSFHYHRSKPLLQRINTNLKPGHIYGLLGLNGEGKTTFLKLIAGLIFPTEGTATVDNLSTMKRSLAFYANMYMLPDQPIQTGLKISEYAAIYSPFYKNFSMDFFSTALQEFSLDARERIKSLSLGQQKKIHLAFALATNTKFLLLDEPTNGLDIPSKNIVRKLLAKTINDDRTIIISTHLIKDIENLMDHLLIFKNGMLAFDMHALEIIKKYKFEQSSSPLEQVLHTEQSLSVYRNLSKNTTEKETNIDIELLFNAVQQNKL